MSLLDYDGKTRFIKDCYEKKFDLEFWKNNFKKNYNYKTKEELHLILTNLKLGRYKKNIIYYLRYDDSKFFSVNVINKINNEEDILNILKKVDNCIIDSTGEDFFRIKAREPELLVNTFLREGIKIEELDEYLKIFF